MKVIAFAGQARSGKDTCADLLHSLLQNKHDVSNPFLWYRLSFAENVKRIFCDAFGVDRDFVEKWKVSQEIPEGFDKRVREGLQFIGDGYRQIQGDIWINKLFKYAADLYVDPIISDVRYYNELNAVKSFGGINVLIYRPGWENDDPNPSEKIMGDLVKSFKDAGILEGVVNREGFDSKGVDYFLINDSSVDDLEMKIKENLLPFVENYFGEK